MRLYLFRPIGSGSPDDPYRCPLCDDGIECQVIADLRPDWSRGDGWAIARCRVTDAQHAQAVRLPGLLYLPFEDRAGRLLGPRATVSDLDSTHRQRILAWLRERGVPVADITPDTTLGDVLRIAKRREHIAGTLLSDNLPEDLSVRFGSLPAAQRQRLQSKLEARGFDLSSVTLQMTAEQLLLGLMRQSAARGGIALE